MQTATLSKKNAHMDDVVVIPRKEYEALLSRKEPQSFASTAAQKRALVKAERNLQKKKTLSFHTLVKELGFTH